MESLFCTYCGHSLVPGTNVCEGCGKFVPNPSQNANSNINQTQIDINQNYTYASGSSIPPNVQVSNQQPDLTDPRVKRNVVEFVNIKPRLFTLSELKDVFFAYLVIYIGFISRRLFFGNIDLFEAIFETIALILGIFGVWLLIDKLISYRYHLYPKFIYDPDRTIMSMVFAFLFIGFPPGYFRYRIWLKKLPKPNNLMKIQFLSNIILILYGYVWYFIIISHSFSNILLVNHPLLDIFFFFPFIISLSVGIGILPFGNFKLILTWNKYLYIILVALTVALIILSFPYLVLATS